MALLDLGDKLNKTKLITFCYSFTLLFASSLLIADTEEAKNGTGTIEKIAQKNLGRDVAFKFRPYMFGMTGIRLDRFRIGENEQYLRDHPYLSPWAFSADSVIVRYNPLGFLIGRISISELKIDNPRVQFAIDGNLTSNFDDIAQKRKKNRFSNWIRVQQMDIKDMYVDVYSEILFAQPIKYEIDDIDVDIRDLAKKKIASIDIAARTPGAESQNVFIKGKVGPIKSMSDPEESPLDIVQTITDAPVAFELAKIPDDIMQDKYYRKTLALPESGLMNMDLKLLGDIWGGLNSKGTLKVEDVVFASIDKELRGIPFDMAVEINTHVGLREQIAKIDNMQIRLNEADITLNGDIKSIVDNPQANLRMFSRNIDATKFNDIYPFVSNIVQIKPVSGTTVLDINAGGNVRQGLLFGGSLKVNELQLATLNEKTKGSRLDAAINLTKPMMFELKKNLLSFDQIDINIVDSLIQIKGKLERVTQVERSLNATIWSDKLNIASFHDFMPFYDEYLPSTLTYDGFLSFKAIATGGMRDGQFTGSADMSDLTFTLENFARKTKKSEFNANYEAKINAKGEFDVSSTFILKEGELDNSTIYIEALKYLLGGDKASSQAKRYLAKINPNKITFSESKGQITYIGKDQVRVKLAVNSIKNSIQKNVDLSLTGDFNYDNYGINFSGEMVFDQNTYKELVKLNPDAGKFLNKKSGNDIKLILPLKVTGTITEPKFSIDA